MGRREEFPAIAASIETSTDPTTAQLVVPTPPGPRAHQARARSPASPTSPGHRTRSRRLRSRLEAREAAPGVVVGGAEAVENLAGCRVGVAVGDDPACGAPAH